VGRGFSRPASAPKKREGEKRLTLALDGETYRRLRMHAAETDQTHQDILEAALAEYLNRANA
jgi:predicted transcriptional regulator